MANNQPINYIANSQVVNDNQIVNRASGIDRTENRLDLNDNDNVMDS